MFASRLFGSHVTGQRAGIAGDPRNVLAKVPAGVQAEIKDAYWALFDTGALKAKRGPRLVELVDDRITSDALRLLQDLRRSLLDPPRQFRPRTVTTTQPDDQPGTVRAIA